MDQTFHCSCLSPSGGSLSLSLAFLSLLSTVSPYHPHSFRPHDLVSLTQRAKLSFSPAVFLSSFSGLPLSFPPFLSLWHLSTLRALILYPHFSPFSSSLFPNTLPPCFALWHPSTQHPPQPPPTSFSQPSSLLFISNSSLFSLHLLSISFPPSSLLRSL